MLNSLRSLRKLLRPYRLLVLITHLFLFAAAYHLAFGLRFDFHLSANFERVFLTTLPIIVVIRAAAFGFFRIYRRWWRFAGVADVLALFKAVTASSIASVVILHLLGQLNGVPRSILILDWAAAVMIFGGLWFAARAFKHEGVLRLRRRQPGRLAVIVIGAGAAGERLVRELQRGNSHFDPIALVDDDVSKHGMWLHSVPVLGGIELLSELAVARGVKRAIIAIPSAPRDQLLKIIECCRRADLECQIVPTLGELLSGRAQVSQVREVQLEDLLGRGAVELDLARAQRDLVGKVVMVTGGAGSIGAELARQVAALQPKVLILLDQAESPLYFVNLEIAAAYPGLEVIPIVADVTDRVRLAGIFDAHRPDFVFHAAAYKHVPLMEHNVIEAVRNNVLGTFCVAENAARCGAEKFLLISTDKAVRPSSVMGATKRIAERIVLNWPALVTSKTDFRAVRFGNVLGSAGSVIPLFKKQLSNGGPLTVTHPEVTRYFMTIPEAAQLVLTAGTLREAAGRISLLEMGEPVRIKDLADNLIRLSGLKPGVDIEVEFTGLRPGEKLKEELMSEVEATVPTGVKKIRVVQTDEADSKDVKAGLACLISSIASGSEHELLKAIGALVPECVSPLRERVAASAKPALQHLLITAPTSRERGRAAAKVP